VRNTATILTQWTVAIPTSFTFCQRLPNSAAVLKRLPFIEQTPAQKSLNRLPVNFMRRPWWTAPSSQGVLQCFDQIACVHMSGLCGRPPPRKVFCSTLGTVNLSD